MCIPCDCVIASADIDIISADIVIAFYRFVIGVGVITSADVCIVFVDGWLIL